MIHKRNRHGFTIVELLIVIVVIAILAAITVVSYNGIQQRAQNAKRDADMSALYKAIMTARISTGKTLMQITGGGWMVGHCTSASANPGAIEPRALPKTHDCWVTYYDVLDKISAASGANLTALKAGDYRGNPYAMDENQGEGGDCTRQDTLVCFTGTGVTTATYKSVPVYETR